MLSWWSAHNVSLFFDYTVNNETYQVKMKHISFATGDAEKAAGLLAEGYMQRTLQLVRDTGLQLTKI